MSHDALYNMHELHSQLMLDRNGISKSFVSYMLSIPRILVHLLPHPLLQSLETLLKVASSPVTLHYNTVFNVGDFYLSTLSLRHGLFEREPIIPCGFLLHSRLQNDHRYFIQMLINEVPLLLSKRINIVTDREFKCSDIFPCGNHLYCWNHLVRDLQWHLKGPCNCSADEINYFVNLFRKLQSIERSDKFCHQWLSARENNHFHKKPKVLNYFENKLLPVFKKYASIWVLRDAQVRNPSNGITNNPSESFNSVLHRLQQWKQVPLDVITVSLYYLSSYYQREITRSIHQCGIWQLKGEYDFLLRESSTMPRLPLVWDPKDIVEKVSASHSCDEQINATVLPQSTGTSITKSAPVKNDTHLGLANNAVSLNRVRPFGDGTWIVMEADGVTPRSVKLHPKPFCSCVATRTCFHITACRMMAGLPLEYSGKMNATEVQRRKMSHR